MDLNPRAASVALVCLLALLGVSAAGSAAAQNRQVFRCEVGGRVVFQQSPCHPSQTGAPVAVPSADTNVGVAVKPAASAAVAAAAPTAAQTAPQTAPGSLTLRPPATPDAADRAACLAYLRPLLRDPASGRITDATRDGRVLRVKLEANDRRGRLRERDAACEFVGGKVDDGWSRVQLKRLGWFAPRVPVVGGPEQAKDRELRKIAREQDESIEKDG